MLLRQVRKDLLAVAYGQFDFGKQNDGLVAFWSLKNPNYPLWHFTTHCGVTALDFSTKVRKQQKGSHFAPPPGSVLQTLLR